MTRNIYYLVNVHDINPRPVSLPNGTQAYAKKFGSVNLSEN